MSAGMPSSKYATDDQGQENYGAGNEQSGNNVFPPSNEASNSRPARLTARIEFGRPHYCYGASMMERTFVTPAPAAGSRKNRRSAARRNGAPG
jgi:hypothetical protein